MRALIVDDSGFIRDYLRQLLERMGVVCVEAENGREAIATLKESPEFDLVLLDLNMPVMDGMECVKELRGAGLSPQSKVMMVTTEPDSVFIRRALEYGADEFLMKPFTPESLQEKLSMMGFSGMTVAA
jgi:two-component system chemotaxis response regulator CheY